MNLLNFVTLIFLDGEKVIVEMINSYINWKSDSASDKQALLKMWSNLDGVYIPSFYEPKYEQNKFKVIEPKFADIKNPRRVILPALLSEDFPDKPIIPFGRPVHDRLRIEIARGCTRGCRFCQAGMIYRPVRERNFEDILNIIEKSILSTGYDEISLLSLSVSDYTCIISLLDEIVKKYGQNHTAVSFPSFRAGTLSADMMNLIKSIRKTGFTIAPEAGSQRLRNVINKNISEEDIFDTVLNAFNLGWQVIKLYFMIGLPTETDFDLEEIVRIVKELKKQKGLKKRDSQINVSVTTFVPKAHTPFQWEPQITLSESKEKIDMLRSALQMHKVQFKWQNPNTSVLEGLFARGDRRLSKLLVDAYKKGCRFDGWSDKFRHDLWKQAFIDSEIDVDSYISKKIDVTESLPWDHIDIRIKKEFFIEERNRAFLENTTGDCRNGDCNNCGICDFDTIAPKTTDLPLNKNESESTSLPGNEIKNIANKKYQIIFSKESDAKYFGHLELVNILFRAFKRVQIPLAYSEGFHPLPKMSFESPLPVGIESLCEKFYVSIKKDINPIELKEKLNKELPLNIRIIDICLYDKKIHKEESAISVYKVKIENKVFDENKLDCFLKKNEYIIERINHKGKRQEIDIRKIVLSMKLISACEIWMEIQSNSIKPADIMRNVFDFSDEEIKLADIIKLPLNWANNRIE
ncbi:MAG: TIGR03960 family B12-binding radical SAM protein [Desulfobacterales bacterium]|nr:TIGR03960 family B12-binding radical SAM protein [Desulfobacterales bacterium]